MRKVDKKAFAARFAGRRKKVGISQAKLAKAAGMKQQGIQNIEAGIVERPRGIEELAEALLTTKKWLLWEEGPEELEPVNPIQQITGLAQKLDPLHLGAAIRYLKTLSERDEAAA